jgi:hypothetical protein
MCAGFGASEGSGNPGEVTLPELLIEGGIFRTQTGQLDGHICAVTSQVSVISISEGVGVALSVP